ncbi:MAG: Cys-tRNA(Pro) deacylase [Oscillospiraceae bacterium]
MAFKTNVMRIFDKMKIDYKEHCYADSDAVSGTDVAKVMGENPEKVFKTLVTKGKPGDCFVFMIPVNAELDLKKAAAAVGEKSVSMIKQKELLKTTGYVHGGCSPVGMKKQFVTTVHVTAANYDTIIFSGGKIGWQVETSLENLKKVVPCDTADIITD